MLLLPKRTHKSELAQPATKKAHQETLYHVFLGGYKNPCFGEKSDTHVRARYLGFVTEVDAYLVQCVADGEILVVPKDVFVGPKVPNKEVLLDRINTQSKYKIGMKVNFRVRKEIARFGGIKVDGRIIAVFGDAYLIHLSPEYYDENDPDIWWSSMDVRFENELFI